MDARQVNLTRFELILPEKRTFFLGGAGIYEVAGLPFELANVVTSRARPR